MRSHLGQARPRTGKQPISAYLQRRVTIRQETNMPRTTKQHLDARLKNTLRRVLAGRKRVSVARWQWNVPQAITTLQRAKLPPQRLLPGRRLENVLMRFSQFVEMLTEDDDPDHGGSRSAYQFRSAYSSNRTANAASAVWNSRGSFSSIPLGTRRSPHFPLHSVMSARSLGGKPSTVQRSCIFNCLARVIVELWMADERADEVAMNMLSLLCGWAPSRRPSA